MRKTTQGHKYAQSTETAIVREIISLVTRDEGRIANHYADSYLDRHEGEEGLPTRQRLHRIMERLARDNQLRTTTAKGRTATLVNYHPITYTLGGKPISINGMVKHRLNVHGLAYEAIRQRLQKGMSPADALALPKTKRGKLAESSEQHRRDDHDPGW